MANSGESPVARRKGGWVTFPFLTGTMMGLVLAQAGCTTNMIVYLIKEFNMKSIDAAQVSNIINGCLFLSPVAGAIVSDSFFGCFPVIAAAAIISFLSTLLFTLTATIPSLRPAPCTTSTGPCNHQPSAAQLAVLYGAVGLLAVANGGTRFNIMTMGAYQFDETKDRDVFFNWYFTIMYSASIIGATVIVYVQDSVSWGLGFGLCLAVSAVSAILLMAGMRYYRRPKAQGSPFTEMARVIVAAMVKRKVGERQQELNYYHGSKSETGPPMASFRFLNRAAVVTDGDTTGDGSIAKPWRLCTVSQAEDLKALLRIFPLWTSNAYLSIAIGMQISLSVLQALTMDRSLGPGFSYPAGSVPVFTLAITALVLPLIDRVLIPSLRSLTHWYPTPLQRLGLGHVLTIAAMAVSALVERRRAGVIAEHGQNGNPAWTVPMSVMWLLLPLATTGLGEAVYLPAQVALFYQEFPLSLRSTSTGVASLLIAIGFYASTAVIGTVRTVTDWLPDNVNAGKMENVFWMLTVVGTVNFGYYLLCACLYKYQNKEMNKGEGQDSVSSDN